MVKYLLKTCYGRKKPACSFCQVVTLPSFSGCCGLLITFGHFILHLIGCEYIPEILFGVHRFMEKRVAAQFMFLFLHNHPFVLIF